jgi:flagellar protein FliS
MMNPAAGARAYQKTDITAATPMQLIVKMYDAAISSAVAGRDAMVRKDIPARRDALNKLMAILAELQNTLDLERGGEVAIRLDGLYTYMFSKILNGIAKQDAAPIEETRRLLAGLRDAWQQAATAPATPDAARERSGR